ncbi:MAG TPA: hypothetical protein P5277_02140 [Candidatus Paceibacterota bacterium]|nr:hypothetical protein [Candidatus Paceibacterota bacterium]
MEKNFGLSDEEMNKLKGLDSPAKIQEFLDSIPINFEEDGKDTCISPRMILRHNKCHCIEGAILGAFLLRLNGHKPLLVDMTASKDDFDHVIAVFKQDGKWGAISKTNHATLRYREPIYNSIRELVMSYFHEYTNDDGKKTLRSFSVPINLARFDKKGWVTSEKDLWYIASHIDKVKHFKILTKKQAANLSKSSQIEQKISRIIQFEPPATVDKERIKNL